MAVGGLNRDGWHFLGRHKTEAYLLTTHSDGHKFLRNILLNTWVKKFDVPKIPPSMLHILLHVKVQYFSVGYFQVYIIAEPVIGVLC